MVVYTEFEEKRLNRQLAEWQKKAEKMILDIQYDKVRLTELQHSALQKLTNAESNKDINYALWNSGLIENTLESIRLQMKY